MVLSSTSVLMVEQTLQNGCHQCLFPQRKSHWPPASLRGSLRSASVSDPSFYQIIASALGLKACEILHVLFNIKVSVSYSLPAPLYESPTGLQSKMFWGPHLPDAGSPDWGA